MHSRAPRPTPAQAPPARYEPYEPYLDGLFTYCLSVLCDHDAATAVLGDVLAVAERQHGRCPSREPERRAWLYALARWACLRRLAEQKRRRQGAHRGHRAPDPAPGQVSAEADETALRRRRELALLAWPEAAGTTPEQRDALERARATVSARARSPPSWAWTTPPPANCWPPRPARWSAPGPRSPSWRAAAARSSPV